MRAIFPGKGDPHEEHRGSGTRGLRWWICFSGALHLVLVLTLLLVPASTARRDSPVPVYTVDLVAGDMPGPRPDLRSPERQEVKPARAEPLPPLDEADSEPAVPDPPKITQAPEELPPPPKAQAKEPPPRRKKVVKAPEKPKKKLVEPKKAVETKKVVKTKKQPVRRSPGKVVTKKVVRKPPQAPKPKNEPGKDSRLVQRLNRRRIDAAVAAARERARLQREARTPHAGSETSGAGSGNGGALVRGMEFVAYRNGMLGRIKERWTWIGKRRDLKVTVGFGIGVDGEIFGLRLLKSSGDLSYDESVIRAVRGASPLPPPPPRHAREFAQVELVFRPAAEDG